MLFNFERISGWQRFIRNSGAGSHLFRTGQSAGNLPKVHTPGRGQITLWLASSQRTPRTAFRLLQKSP